MSLTTLTTGPGAATVTVQRATPSQTDEGFPKESYANVSALTSIKCRIYSASQRERERYGKASDHAVENIAFFDGHLDIRATDLIVWGSQSMRVVAVDRPQSPSAALRHTKVVCTETINSGEGSLGR